MRTWRTWIGVGLLGGLLATGAACQEAGYSESAPAEPAPREGVRAGLDARIGALAPDFVLWDLNSKPMSLASQRGRIVLLNFWATWCGPCRVEMPAMQHLYEEFNRRGFQILAVSTDAQGAAVTRPFADSLGLTFPILHDSDFQVGLTYGTRTLPMSFLVDRQGIIRHRIFGARDWHSPDARRLIETLLAEARTS